MIEANILTVVKATSGKTVGEYKPTDEDLICLNCSKSDCKKGVCKRFNEELRKIRRGKV